VSQNDPLRNFQSFLHLQVCYGEIWITVLMNTTRLLNFLPNPRDEFSSVQVFGRLGIPQIW